MNITLTIPDSAVPAYQAAADKFNAGSGQPPVNITQHQQILFDEQTVRYNAALDSDQRAAIAANTRILNLGKLVAAQPDKIDAVEAAVLTALSE